MTFAPLHPTEATIHNKVSAMKLRLSSKKTEASLLFSNITTENDPEHRIKGQLELIYDILKKQQENEGSLH